MVPDRVHDHVHPHGATLGGERLDFQIQRRVARPDFVGGGAQAGQRLRRQKTAGVTGHRLKVSRRGLQNAVQFVSPDHLAGHQVELPAADLAQRLHGLQQLGFTLQLQVQGAQPLLLLLALGDVGVGADHAQGLALGIAAHHHAVGHHPDPDAVFALHAHIHRVMVGIPCQVGGPGRMHPCGIAGMEVGKERLHVFADLMVGIAQHRLPARRVGLVTGHQIPIPNARTRTLQGQPPGVGGLAVPRRQRPQGSGGTSGFDGSSLGSCHG